MKQRIIHRLIGMGETILKTIGQSFWNEFWQGMIVGVQNVEIQYHSGEFKRDKVIEAALEFITLRTRVSWWQKKLIRLFIGYVIDEAITAINQSFGKDWVTKLNEVRGKLEELLPFMK